MVLLKSIQLIFVRMIKLIPYFNREGLYYQS